MVAAGAIACYLLGPTDLALLRVAGFVYGGALCSSVIWGPWLAELYPPHLRSTAASIFNWGRVISFFAPLATAALAGRFGLPWAMASGCVAFLLAAAIWRAQRETLREQDPETVPAPENSPLARPAGGWRTGSTGRSAALGGDRRIIPADAPRSHGS